MYRIKEIWDKLKKDSSTSDGIVKIRYSDVSICDVYLGLKMPEDHPCLILGLPVANAISINFDRKFKGLHLEKLKDPVKLDGAFIKLTLLNNQFSDVFDTLLLDVISNIIDLTDKKKIANEFFKRIIKWQSLFEKLGPEGLTEEQQRGLFGELYFIRKCLQAGVEKKICIQAWLGPEKGVRDFQLGDWAIEVKTSNGNNHQKVFISSERQLDASSISNLFLYHISLDSVQGNGEFLHQIVNDIFKLLTDDFIYLSCFKEKLIQACYFDFHKERYLRHGYFIRNDNFYKVERDFPRIEEGDIRVGLGDVKYSIILSNCAPYLVSEILVFKCLM